MKYSETNPPLYCPQNQSSWMKGAVKNGKPVGILWHDTAAGNPYIKRYVQPDDNAPDRQYWLDLLGINKYANDWNHSNRDAGLNCWVGKLADESVATVQAGPWTTHPWGCGGGDLGSCNGYTRTTGSTNWVPEFWIQFEICDDGYEDGSGTKEYFFKVYREACEITAYLCKMFDIDPKGTVEFAGIQVPTILCHQDSYRKKLGSDHSDVLKWFKLYGYTMDNVRNDVYDLLHEEPAEPIKVGDLVAIKPNATYWSGAAIPARIKAQNWYVSKINDKRAVIDENESHTESICSPINVDDLILVKAATEVDAPDPQPAPIPEPTPTLELYRVGQTVEEIMNQHYSYIDFDQAKALCDEKGYGYHVFTVNGKLVYSAPAPVEDPEPKPEDPTVGGAPTTEDSPEVPEDPTNSTDPSEKEVNWFVRMIKAFIEALRRIFTSDSKKDE